MNFEGAKQFILNKLNKELDPRLTYHSVSHTLDVLNSALRLASMENVSGRELELIKVACVYHDSGMLRRYSGHEEASAEIADEVLPQFGYMPGDLIVIKNMIMATRLPQLAVTITDKILCDADLDYLGRPDFFMIAHQLKYEWDMLEFNPTTLGEWYKIQIDFLTKHTYFTRSALALREDYKQKNLEEIKSIICNEK